jgi:DNA polymerase sigma
MKVKYIQMSSETMKKWSHTDDYSKIQNDTLITEEQLNTSFRGISAATCILINDSIVNDYEIVYEDDSIEVGHW